MGLPKGPQVNLVIDWEMIKLAKQKHSRHCMIADAVKAAFPAAKFISVDLQTIRFSDPEKGLRYTYLTPRIGQVAIVKFDLGSRKLAPFKMRLKRAHVTATANRTKEQRDRMNKKTRARNAELKKVKLRRTLDTRAIPVGGRPPPLQRIKDQIPYNQRREFGVKGLERPDG